MKKSIFTELDNEIKKEFGNNFGNAANRYGKDAKNYNGICRFSDGYNNRIRASYKVSHLLNSYRNIKLTNAQLLKLSGIVSNFVNKHPEVKVTNFCISNDEEGWAVFNLTASKVCKCCGEPLEKGSCYNDKCKAYDPLSQYFN